MPSLHESAAAQLRDMVAKAPPGMEQQLMAAVLRLAAKWRSQVLSNTTVSLNGLSIQHGPFAGMRYLPSVAEGALMARLVGAYEGDLHPHIEAFAAGGLDHVVDIGCAEGYYAVGLARMIPGVEVHAYDISEQARTLCAGLAAENGVADRVHIAGEFRGEDFATYVDKRALFIVDIEGGEHALLDPDRWPALKRLAFIVETHPHLSAGVTEALIERFSPSHEVVLVHKTLRAAPLPDWLHKLGDLDTLLSIWEWRNLPTPWLVLRPKG